MKVPKGALIIRTLPGLPAVSKQGFSLMLMVRHNDEGKSEAKSFRFILKGGEIPRYNLGEIISLTFDIMSRGSGG